MKRLSFYLTTTVLAAAALAIPAYMSASPERSPRPASQPATVQPSNEVQQFEALKASKAQQQVRTLERVSMEAFDPSAYTEAPVVKMQPRNVMTRSSEEPEGLFYGVFPTWSKASASNEGCIGEIDVNDGSWKIMYRGNVYQIGEESSDYCFQSGAIRENILYIPHFAQDMASGEYNITWRRVDLETGEVLETLRFGSNLSAFLYSMAYDSSRDCFWGLAVNFEGSSGGNLVRINCSGDPSTWQPEVQIANMGPARGEFACNLVYSPLDNCLYSLRDSGEFVQYNPDRATAGVVTVAKFRKEDAPYCFPEVYEGTPITYSPRDHAFVMNFINFTAQRMQLIAIDADTFDTYELSDLAPVGYMASLHCMDAYAPDEAPDRVENLTVTLDKANLTGAIEFDMPTTTFAGLALDPATELSTVFELDGTRVAIKKYLPGQHVSEPWTFTEDLHHIKVFARLSTKLNGPAIQYRFYAGNDNPYAPTNAQLVDYTLTWNAPRAGGVHGGYVDNDAVTYDIFVNGKVSNPAPLTECTYVIPEPSVQTRCNIEVKTLVNGKYSEPANLISRVLGPALELPQTIKPTDAQADLFDTIDADGDADGNFNKFRYEKNTGTPQWSCGTDYYYRQPNDYLFLPKMHFGNPDKQYQLSFDYRQYYDSNNWKSYVEIYLVKTMGLNSARIVDIYTIQNEEVLSWQNMQFRFAVPQAGDYYIVIHESSNVANKCRGSRYKDIKVEQLDYSTNSPDGPTAMSVKADSNGALIANVTVTAPTVNMKNEPLPAGEKLTINLQNGDFTASAEALPGQTVTAQIGAEKNGWQRIFVTVSSSEGASIPKYVLGYVGLDAPTAPQNISHWVDDDNRGMVITWDAPKVGKNGGFVDADNIDYPIYKVDGVSYNLLETLHNERSYHYRTYPSKQTYHYVGPTAKNEMGESTGSQMAFETLGNVYDLPAVEEFNSVAFSLAKWMQDVTTGYSSVQWQNANNLNTLNIGNPIPKEGLMYAINLSESAAMGHLIAPKVSTKDVPVASVNIRYWSCSASAPMELYMRSNKDQTLKKVAEIKASQPLGSTWKDWKVKIPEEYLDCDWIQADLVTTHRSSTTYAVIDSYAVLKEVDYDFQLSDITAPYLSIVGENPQFTATITNGGMEADSPKLTVEILGDGNVLDTKEYTIGRMTTSSIYTQKFNFEMKENYTKYAVLEVRATVKSQHDPYPNNDVKKAVFMLNEHTLPLVRTLDATRIDENNVNLTWQDPAMTFSGHESFECLPPFTIGNQIGQWGNVNNDDTTPFVLEGITWPENDAKQAWTVIDANYCSTMNDERFSPHSGSQFLLARSAVYNTDPIPVEKWLVSPEVKGGTKVTFMYNTLSPSYTETVSVFYTTGDTAIDPNGLTLTDEKDILGYPAYASGEWKQIRNFTKSGAETWEECSFTLPKDAKHFAFVYKSIGMFGAMLDDIDFQQAAPGSWDFDSYEVVREIDGNDVTIATGIKTPGYVDTANGNYEARYYVKTRVNSGSRSYLSPKGNVAEVKGNDGVDEIFGQNTAVAGGKGYIFFGGLNGETVKVFSADGKMVANVTLTDDRQLLNIQPGIYMVTIGKKSTKVLVK